MESTWILPRLLALVVAAFALVVAAFALVVVAFALGGCSDRVAQTDDDDDAVAGDDDTSAGDDDVGDDDDTKPPTDDDTGGDDDGADDDDSGAGDDDDTVQPCDPLGPGVSPTLVLNLPDWQIQHLADGFDEPTGLAIDASEDLIFGAGLGATDSRPVTRLTQALVATASDPIPDPDGVAIDSNGQVFAAGDDQIWLMETLMGGAADTVWHTLAAGGNINDLAIDAGGGDRFYVALDDGRVVRVDQAHDEAVIIGTGDSMELAVDPSGDLWAQGSTSGELYLVDHATDAVTLQADWSTLVPDYLLTNRITLGPADGAIYASVYTTSLGGTVARWDPATPGVLEFWVEQMIDDDNPEDLGWGADCLYVLAPLGGKILRVCPCS